MTRPVENDDDAEDGGHHDDETGADNHDQIDGDEPTFNDRDGGLVARRHSEKKWIFDFNRC